MSYQTIALFAKPGQPKTIDTLNQIVEFMLKRKIQIYFPDYLPLQRSTGCQAVPKEELTKNADLMIVVGGDGSLLQASHLVVDHSIPIIGINLGRLGFLTDIHPNELQEKLNQLLNGHFKQEERFLLEARVGQHHCYALNDIVLATGNLSSMIEYSVYINDHFVCADRGDGLIIATPTGSTAYALSAGGPILHPNLDAIAIVSMFSHRLTARPIVVSGNSEIKIVLSEKIYDIKPKICYDGIQLADVEQEKTISIQKKKQTLHLLHPEDYDYYANVRSKLAWSK